MNHEYRVWLINFGWYLEESFNDLDSAIFYGKSKGYDFRVDRDETPICAWSIIGGLRYFSKER